MEIGIGIHGEPGRQRLKVEPAAKIVERLASAVVEDLPYNEGDEVLAFVNGMGGTPLIELYIVYNELNKFLQARGTRRAGSFDRSAPRGNRRKRSTQHK